jgi:choline kinase
MKVKVDTVVICAAGLGSRLGLDTPKCLVKIGNHPLIYYLLKVLKDVKNVRMVVGFKEEEVINYVRSIRNDVLFIRNKNYMSTTNAYSLYLGSYDLKAPFMNIDGDMYIDQANFDKFCSSIHENEDLIGVTKSYTEDAVLVKVNEKNEVVAFSRDKISDLEWTGIAYFSNITISKEGKYVYQEIEKYLPVKAIEIECFEIDTPRDLEILSNKTML